MYFALIYIYNNILSIFPTKQSNDMLCLCTVCVQLIKCIYIYIYIHIYIYIYIYFLYMFCVEYSFIKSYNITSDKRIYYYYHYYWFIDRFPKELDFPFITFILHLFLSWTFSLSISLSNHVLIGLPTSLLH